MTATNDLLLQIAGYLKLVELGVAPKAEATELIEKIGALLAEVDKSSEIAALPLNESKGMRAESPVPPGCIRETGSRSRPCSDTDAGTAGPAIPPNENGSDL